MDRDGPRPGLLRVGVLVAALVLVPGLCAEAVAGSSSVSLVLTGAPELAVTKRGTVVDANLDGRIGAGDRVRWTITVSNPGDTILTSVTVSDPRGGSVSCPSRTLVPDQTMTCTVPDHVITAAEVAAGEVTNRASASATDPAGQVVAATGYGRVAIPTEKPVVVFPPVGVPGFPGGPAGHPGSDGPGSGGPTVGGGAAGGGAAGGGAVGGAGPGAGSGIGPGSGSGAGPAGPGSTGGQDAASPSPGEQGLAEPPDAVAGGRPDEPGQGGLTMVLLGAVTAVGALTALGILGGRRTRRRR